MGIQSYHVQEALQIAGCHVCADRYTVFQSVCTLNNADRFSNNKDA